MPCPSGTPNAHFEAAGRGSSPRQARADAGQLGRARDSLTPRAHRTFRSATLGYSTEPVPQAWRPDCTGRSTSSDSIERDDNPRAAIQLPQRPSAHHSIRNMSTRLPRLVSRALLRLPVGLYRVRAGWLLGSRFLLLTHTGRKSGRRYRTVLEVMRFDPVRPAYIVCAGRGHRSQWFQNVMRNPHVTVTVGTVERPARAECLSTDVARIELLRYAHAHPVAFALVRQFLGRSLRSVPAACDQLARQLPVLALHVGAVHSGLTEYPRPRSAILNLVRCAPAQRATWPADADVGHGRGSMTP